MAVFYQYDYTEITKNIYPCFMYHLHIPDGFSENIELLHLADLLMMDDLKGEAAALLAKFLSHANYLKQGCISLTKFAFLPGMPAPPRVKPALSSPAPQNFTEAAGPKFTVE